jgi:hypothetical protein
MGITFTDKGPWRVESLLGAVDVISSDPTNAVGLSVGGEWATLEDKIKYAHGLAELLNRHNGNN